MSTQPRRSLNSHLLGIWWITWFGILGAFLFVAVAEHSYMSSSRGASASRYSVTLVIVTILLWALFYFADARVRRKVKEEESRSVVVGLLTLTGTCLAIFTLLGIFFFIYVAPRLR